MKLLFLSLAFAAFACGQIVDMTAGEVNPAHLKRYLAQVRVIEQMKSKMDDVCPDQSEQMSDRLEETLLMMQECIDSIPDQQETLCSMIRNHFVRCTRPMTKLMSDCAPEPSKELPYLITEAIVSASNYTCRTDGEHIFEFTNPCIMKENYRLMRCERKLKVKMQQFDRKAPNKVDFCAFLQDMKPCLQSHLNFACGNEITKESFLGLFDALMAPCANVQNEFVAENEVETLA